MFCLGGLKSAALRQGSEPCLAEDDLKELLGHNVMPLLRLLYAQAAATCCALARALSCKCPKKQARHPSEQAAWISCSLDATRITCLWSKKQARVRQSF